MTTEKTGFNIKVTCSQDPSIHFECRTKKIPGVRLCGKIDVSTDDSSPCKTFEPGRQLEITDGELTVLDHISTAAKIIAILGKKGTISFSGTTGNQTAVFPDAWFASYVPDEIKQDLEPPTATIIIQSSGTLPIL
ncbi:MAG: hypothetical protein IJW05_09005 [Lentisphaeria bacterium]|nr:hypothetical protein [Lentisphaeria bacterium]